MKPDLFEERLRTQPLKPLPPVWREEILGAARGSAQEDQRGLLERGGLERLCEWFWPHPVAWAGLAACWVAVAGLHRAAAPSPAEVAQAQESARMAAAYSALWYRPEAAALTVEPPVADSAAPPRRRVPDQGRHESPSAFMVA